MKLLVFRLKRIRSFIYRRMYKVFHVEIRNAVRTGIEILRPTQLLHALTVVMSKTVRLKYLNPLAWPIKVADILSTLYRRQLKAKANPNESRESPSRAGGE